MDNRVRIRPKQGYASWMYSQNNFSNDLPWLKGSSIGLPNPIKGSDILLKAGDVIGGKSNLGSIFSNAANNISQNVQGIASNVVNNATNMIRNIPQTVGNLVSQTINNSVNQALFGNSGGGQNPNFGQLVAVYNNPNYNQNFLEPLSQTNGLVFQYTPSITFSNSASYTDYAPTHSNFQYNSYNSSSVTDITVSGDFNVNCGEDAYYALAAIHFVRTVTKMDFGNSPNAGTPPPVLLFSGYGYSFNDIPCVVVSSFFDFSKDVDYVRVGDLECFIPVSFTMTMTLKVHYTPTEARNFSLERFKKGGDLKGYV